MEKKNIFKIDDRFYYGWVMLFMGFMCMFIAYVIKANCTSLFVIPITEELNVTRTAYIMNNTILTITMLIASSFMGRLMNKKPLKYVLTVCVVIISLVYIGMSRATSLWQFYVLSGIQGFAWAGATNLPVNIMVSNWFGSKIKGTAMSIGMLGSGAGALVWVNLVRQIVDNSGWRTAYLAMAGIMAIMIPLSLLLVVNRPEEKGFRRRIGDLSPEEIEATGGVLEQKRGIEGKQAIKLPRWWLQFAAHLITMICASGFTTQCVAYFVDLGLDNKAAALIYSTALGTLIIGKFILGAVSDVIKIRRAAVIAPIIFSATFIFLNLSAKNLSFSNGIIWTYMIGGSIASVIPPLITAYNFGDKDYGTMAGWMNMAGNIGQIIGPMIAALIFDTTGSYGTAWIVFAVLMFFGVGGSYFASSRVNKKELADMGYVLPN